MPRRVEDIVQNDRRSIRNIVVPRTQPSEPAHTRSDRSEKDSRAIPIHRLKIPLPPRAEPRKKRKGKGGRKWLIVVVVVIAVVAMAGYVASAYFSRATFTIMPVIVDVSANTTFVATGTTTPGYLHYTTARYSDTAATDVPAADGPYISTKASGRVTLYNAYSAQAQRLIAGTRFSGDTGLIYRLTGSVTIPGYTTSTKGVKVPGALTVSISADAAGADYNLPKTEAGDLKVVLYKGGPRYDTIYARLASDISGGFVGQKKTISPALLASTSETLQSMLATRLLSAAQKAVPDGYTMYDSAYKTVFSPPAISGTNADKATVTVSGTLYSVLFKTVDLASKLAGADKVAAFGGLPYTTPGLDALSFTITNPADFSPTKGTALIARVKGDMKLVGTIPVETLKTKLKGLPLSETSKVFEMYRPVMDITRSSGELFPSWAAAVPNDIGRISIVVLTK